MSQPTAQVTVIEYHYADEANYKAYNTVVLPGILTDEQTKAIWGGIVSREMFLPEQVGLPALQDMTCDDDEDDPNGHHIWHFLDDIKTVQRGWATTEIEPLRPMSAEQFAAQFPGIVWDEVAAQEALDALLGDMAW